MATGREASAANSRGRAGRIAFYHVYVAFTLGAAAALLIPQSASGRGSNLVFSVAWIAMQAVSVVMLIGFRAHNGKNLILVGLFGAFIVASAAWSVSPMDSLVYGSMVAGNIATAYMVSQDLDLSEILRMSAKVIIFLAVIGMVAALAGYSQALYFDPHGRPNVVGTHAIRGFFNHKVLAALFASLGAVAAVHSYRGMKRLVIIFTLGFFVVLTGSSTGLILFPAALLIIWVLRRMRRMKAAAAAAVLALLVVGALGLGVLPARWNEISAALGRDPTLTGRTLLWEWGYQTWLQRPVFGYGFDGYFNGPDAAAISAAVRRFENYGVPHFHQSYIQTAVDLGAVGLLILVLVQLSIIIGGWRLMRSHDAEIGVAVLATMLTMVIAAMTMFLFITYNHYTTFMMFVFFFALRRLVPHRFANSVPHRGINRR